MLGRGGQKEKSYREGGEMEERKTDREARWKEGIN